MTQTTASTTRGDPAGTAGCQSCTDGLGTPVEVPHGLWAVKHYELGARAKEALGL